MKYDKDISLWRPDMKNYKLGNFICELREDAGMDQKTLAALLGVSASAISQCENGGGIKTEKLYQLSELFGVTLDELLSGKRVERPIAEQLDELYYIDEEELMQAVDDGDYENIEEMFQRIKTVRERFDELIYKRIFAKLTTDENAELKYLERYYNQNLYNSKYFTATIVFFEDSQRYDYIKETLFNAIGGSERSVNIWELNKIFTFKFDLRLQEIMEMLGNDDRIETEQRRLECFASVFDALPSLTKNLLLSQIVYGDGSLNSKLGIIEIMLERGAKLIYLPSVKNMTHVDGDLIAELDGDVEFDKTLTDVIAIYQKNCVNDFSYGDFIRLTLDEYYACINDNGMGDLLQLVNLWQDNKIAYWNKFKTAKFYCKLS